MNTYLNVCITAHIDMSKHLRLDLYGNTSTCIYMETSIHIYTHIYTSKYVYLATYLNFDLNQYPNILINIKSTYI
jgi:hypothetical protein